MTKNPQIRLYGLVPYDRGAKVRWLMTEMGIPFENVWLDRSKKEHESPAFLKLNSMGRVPAITIDDMVMMESGAICAYLADRYLDKKMAPALDSPLRTEYQQWMYFASATLDTLQTRIMIVEDIPSGDYQKAKEESVVSDLHDSLETLDQVLSKNSFLVGNQLSAADICVGYHLTWLKLWPELNVVYSKFPSINAYLERLQKLPSAIKANVFSYEA